MSTETMVVYSYCGTDRKAGRKILLDSCDHLKMLECSMKWNNAGHQYPELVSCTAFSIPEMMKTSCAGLMEELQSRALFVTSEEVFEHVEGAAFCIKQALGKCVDLDVEYLVFIAEDILFHNRGAIEHIVETLKSGLDYVGYGGQASQRVMSTRVFGCRPKKLTPSIFNVDSTVYGVNDASGLSFEETVYNRLRESGLQISCDGMREAGVAYWHGHDSSAMFEVYKNLMEEGNGNR